MTTVSIDLSPKSKQLLGRIGKETRKSIATAHKRAGISAQRKMRTEVNRIVRAERTLTHGKLSQLVTTFVRGTSNSPAFGVHVDGKPIAVSKLRFRQTKKGVRFSVKRGAGASSFIRGAFTMRLKSGHIGVFKRKGTERLPVDEMFTTGIASTFKDESKRLVVYESARFEYERTLERNLKL